MPNLTSQRRTVITEQTVLLMSTPCKTDAQKHSFRADISIDYVDPKHPARVVQHYKSEPAELGLELPGSYRNFCAECLFKTKVGFGLLRHREVSVQYILEVNKAKTLYAGIAPIVRAPSKDPRYVSRILDGGALGVIVPHIRSVQDAKDVVAAAKF
ncbi:hypothetical protein D6D05_02661 [Aureobasidium pullulans]|nr:hypothetical protein D6D05_02661 [Aureobasidium pullulans]